MISHVDAAALTPRLPENKRKKYVLVASLIGLLVILVLVASYLVSRQFNEIHIWGWTFEIEDKCPKKIGGRFFADTSILMSAISVIPFTAYLGLITHRVKVGRAWQGMLENTGFCKSLARFII